MNHVRRSLALLIITLIIPQQALAHGYVIASLGHAPLIGPIASTGALQHQTPQEQDRFRRAAAALGLSASEYADFTRRLQQGYVSYVTLPRHLDAMSWSSGGQVYVERDVTIPADTRGWDVEVASREGEVSVLIPARCGNLSIVRHSVAGIAKVVPAQAPPAPSPLEVAAAPPQEMPVAVEAEQYTPAVAPIAAPAAPPVTHRAILWPFLAVALIGFGFNGHGATSSPTALPVSGGNSPPPVSCKSVAKLGWSFRI